MPLAYLATPYTKVEGGLDYAFKATARVAGKLLAAGVQVYSPIAHCHPIAIHSGLDPLDLTIWYPHNTLMLEHCETLIVAHMDGWQESAGIQYEVEFFTARHKPIFDLDCDSLRMTRRT